MRRRCRASRWWLAGGMAGLLALAFPVAWAGEPAVAKEPPAKPGGAKEPEPAAKAPASKEQPQPGKPAATKAPEAPAKPSAPPAEPIEETKLGRGITNILAAPLEIPISAYSVAADTNVFVGVTAGVIAGGIAGIERLLAGTLDVATFCMPPKGHKLVKYDLGKSPAVRAAIAEFGREGPRGE